MRLDPRRDVDADPGHVVATSFHLTGMYTDPYFHAELARTIADRESTLNGPSWTVERGENAVSGGLDLSAAEAMDLPLGHEVVVTACLVEWTTSVNRMVARIRSVFGVPRVPVRNSSISPSSPSVSPANARWSCPGSSM